MIRLPSLSALCLGVSLAFAAGCGGGDGPKTAKLTPGDMPSGEEWRGVYYHQVYGNLHLVEEGTNIVGRWKRTNQSAWGELSGTKQGNVLRYQWKEHQIGMVGASAESQGKGYFVFKQGKEGIAELDGEFGIGNDETGSDWHCVKQLRVNPDLKSIGGDAAGIATPGATKGWE